MADNAAALAAVAVGLLFLVLGGLVWVISRATGEGDAAAAWFSELLGKSVRLVRWLGDGSLPRAAIESARGVGGGGGGAVEARSVVHWFPYDPVRVVNADP